MENLLWITDAHLDHLPDVAEDAWFENLGKSRADMLLLGGDTANARVFSRVLRQIEEVFPGKVALVAGNHDYYYSSISEFRTKLSNFQRAGVIVFEPGCQAVPITLKEGVYLCGSGGWGDAAAGLADASYMPLNDENLIAELRGTNLTARLRKLGRDSAEHLQEQLSAVPEDASCVIILAHVPPWPEASWHEGRNSDAMALPRFCWLAGGNVIALAAERSPQTRFIVLCGHTHSGGIWRKGNITCHTAASAYGRAGYSGTISLGNRVSVRRLDR